MTEEQARNILNVWYHRGHLKPNIYEGYSGFNEMIRTLMTHGENLEK